MITLFSEKKINCGAAAGSLRRSARQFGDIFTTNLCAYGKPLICFLEQAWLRTLHLGCGWTSLSMTKYPQRDRIPGHVTDF